MPWARSLEYFDRAAGPCFAKPSPRWLAVTKRPAQGLWVPDVPQVVPEIGFLSDYKRPQRDSKAEVPVVNSRYWSPFAQHASTPSVQIATWTPSS